MSSINTNVSAMAAVRSLSSISNAMTNTQARIESGLRISQANHDPAVFAISQTMRGDIKGLEAVRDGLAFGKATLTVARDAATKISNELNELKRTVTQGQQQGLDIATMNAQVASLTSNMRSFAQTATFNGVNLLDDSSTGDRALNVLRDISGNTIGVANQALISQTGQLLNLEGLNVAQGAVRISPPANIEIADGNFIAVQLNAGTPQAREIVFEFNADSDTGANTLAQVSNASRRVVEVKIGDGTNLTPQAELGRLVDAMKSAGIGARINQDGTLDIMAANVTGVAYQLTAGGAAIDGSVSRADVSATNWTTSAAAYTAPTGATGVGTFGATGANTAITVVGGTADGAGNITNASSAIAVVDAAISTVNTALSTIGSRLSQVEGQQEFTKQLTDSIREGLGALVDADLAEESARLTSLQTRQQLATQSLSIANQQSQSLLSLFR
ncbi:flagellin [Falsiroseomonas oryziterrae]|uniref:flagellin n=1 Tax=Falsiroseomonas oryziterrae TaxID=2911368 RepID=UPI002351378B|nr:flagellin [Roseomonas sp. NPKOSM-4]